MELYELKTADGQTYFAAKLGLLVVGIIMPLRSIEEQFVQNLEALAKRSRAALKLKAEREAKAQHAGQVALLEGGKIN